MIKNGDKVERVCFKMGCVAHNRGLFGTGLTVAMPTWHCGDHDIISQWCLLENAATVGILVIKSVCEFQRYAA
jgi:hypothetical protein